MKAESRSRVLFPVESVNLLLLILKTGMTRLLKFSQFPDYYCEQHIIGDFHVFRKIPPWTELVLMPQIGREEAHALVAWFPPNAFHDLTVLDHFGWEGGTGNWALIEVVSFSFGDVDLVWEGTL
jgi:hypothetical protein